VHPSAHLDSINVEQDVEIQMRGHMAIENLYYLLKYCPADLCDAPVKFFLSLLVDRYKYIDIDLYIQVPI
jgi:hypothetical protein